VEAWRRTIELILERPGTVVMLGPVDVGKTTAATALANAAVRAGRPTAVVDADTGQSDIGPPATVALGLPQHPVRAMADLPAAAAYFVGDTSPRRVYRWLVEGAVRLVGRARARGAEVVVVDTTGWVEGPAAVAAKVHKIGRIDPRHVIAIQREEEVEPILARLSGRIAVHRFRPSPAVRPRSSEERRAIRERRFHGYFGHAHRHVLHLAALQALRPATYARRKVPQTRMLTEIPAAALRHLLVGLADQEGWLQAMGTVVATDPGRQEVTVAAPLSTLTEVRGLQWGVLRVAPSGLEEGRLRAT